MRKYFINIVKNSIHQELGCFNAVLNMVGGKLFQTFIH